MVEHLDTLDAAFGALADPTRRAIVDRLCRGPASVSELAEPFEMTLAAIVQHVQVLEASGLVGTEKRGRVRTCHVESNALREVERWISERRTGWEQRLDRLGEFLGEEPPPSPTRTTRKK
jgi:DNA-binding transcriptional ArsR family regulator